MEMISEAYSDPNEETVEDTMEEVKEETTPEVTTPVSEEVEVAEDKKFSMSFGEFKVKEVVTKEQTDNAFKIYVDNIKQSGTAGEKMVVETMEQYIEAMGTNRPIPVDEIVKEQSRLYGMFKNIGRRDQDFRKSVVAARAYFKEYYDTVLHDTKINRGHEALNMNADDRKAFYSYLQLYKILATVNDLKDVNKSVTVSRSLNNPVIPTEVLDRYIALVN
jgi:hypothetical protein